MESLFNSETHQDILKRLNNLNENSTALWGKMNIGQMFKHCQLPIKVALGENNMEMKVGFIKKQIFKLFKPMMYSVKPWKHNMQTAKEFIITEPLVFESERTNLVTLINEFASKKDHTNWPEHPVFGYFTTEQRGKMQYKHIDHHLRQFGA